MREARADAREEGIDVRFAFSAHEVERIHTCFHKLGHGVYFRLKDGRVFSALGTELDPNPACYDSPCSNALEPPSRAELAALRTA
jgi:hypothetical protein